MIKQRLPLRTLAASIILVATPILSGCGELTTQSPLEHSHQSFSTVASGDSASWVDNVLEFEYGGTTWRLERDQEDATTADLYESDVLVASLAITWSGGVVSEVTMVKNGEWMSTTASGAFLATSLGPPGSGGEGPCEEPSMCCDPENILDPGQCDPQNLQGPPCEDEYSEAISAGNDAISAGIVAMATSWAPKLNIATLAYAVIKTADYGGKLLTYATCRYNSNTFSAEYAWLNPSDAAVCQGQAS